jgi:hypothetical protein
MPTPAVTVLDRNESGLLNLTPHMAIDSQPREL